MSESQFINNNSNVHNLIKIDGYWEPHSSSIDFCETNYLHTNLIVEVHNVWSSILGLSLFGIVGIIYGNPTKETRTFIYYFILFIIGIGSACLHGTLHWYYQSSDELPMLWLVLCGVYAVIEVDSPAGQPKYPNLALYLIGVSCLNTAIYYRFQHLFIVFFINFNMIVYAMVYKHLQIAWRIYKRVKEEERLKEEEATTKGSNNNWRTRNDKIALRFYVWHAIVYTLIASPLWVLDQFHCEYLLPIYNNKLPGVLQGCTLHVLWHVFAGLGAYYFGQFLCTVRATTLGISCDTRRVLLGVLPVVVVVDDDKSIAASSGNEKKD